MKIKSRFDNRTLYECEADSLLEALQQAVKSGVNLRGANLRGADLSGADLSGANLIDAGQDRRGYRFVAVSHDDGIRIAAGCRWFTLAEARKHWKTNAEALAKVEMIAAEAARRDWRAEHKETSDD